MKKTLYLLIYLINLKTVKKTILICLLALMAFSAKSQKLEKPIIDKITGDTSISTTKERIYNKGLMVPDILYCKVNKIMNSYILDFEIGKAIDVSFIVAPENSIILKVDNGELITLKSLNKLYSKTRYASSGGYSMAITECNIPIVLSRNDIEKLKKSKIKIIRIENSYAPFDYEIKDKNSELIKHELELFKL